MMIDIDNNENFEPSSETKVWWLYTHKTPHKIAGVLLPGVFQTTNYVEQILGFIAIFLLEGLATFWCFSEGVIITAILASIVVDLVLALVAHLYQKDICRLQNELIYEEQNKQGAIALKLKSLKLRQNFFYLLIMISAIFKIFWFYDVYRIIDATTLFIMTCYIVGAILHITCTGYVLFTFRFSLKMKSEYKKFLKSNQTEYVRTKASQKLNYKGIKEVVAGPHRVTKRKDGQIYLETLGVLTDKELRGLILNQPDAESQGAMAKAGVRHQISMLGQDMTTKETQSNKNNATEEEPKMGVVS